MLGIDEILLGLLFGVIALQVITMIWLHVYFCRTPPPQMNEIIKDPLIILSASPNTLQITITALENNSGNSLKGF